MKFNMAFFSEKIETVPINEIQSIDMRFDMNTLKNLAVEEQWDFSSMGIVDFSYLTEKVSNKYHAVNIVIEDKISEPGKSIYSLAYRFSTDKDKLAFVLKFS